MLITIGIFTGVMASIFFDMLFLMANKLVGFYRWRETTFIATMATLHGWLIYIVSQHMKKCLIQSHVELF